jgi:replicative DNA helicase
MIDELADLRQLDLPFDVDNVDQQCIECIRAQLVKYEKHQDASGKTCKGRFLVDCFGIPKDIIDPTVKTGLSSEQIENLEAVQDIVKFAKKYLQLPDGTQWEAREYQEKVLRCTSRRKVLRIGRRTGKTDSVCVEICYYLFTQKKCRLLVVGPQKVHVEEIFGRVRAFIAANPLLADSVVHDISAPYYRLELSNGSELRGFAGGTTGKKEGTSIRGQNADRIYIEECDYVDENALQGAIMPILHTTPTTTLVAFSTPSGFKSVYYSMCCDSPAYKEYHYTYKVLPHWKQVEAEKSAFTEEQWNREYLANFGDAESGVYKPHYIDRASTNYEYSNMIRNPVWKYTIGTDWNEKHGTEICVLGYNSITHTFQVVEALLIEKSEFTQLSGISKLLEMNKKWKPSFVYIDAGNGSTNYELLRKTAYENSSRDGDRDTARLLQILKRYDSGASIEIRDPVSQQKIKAPAKPFMVNSSVRLFEQNKIKISSFDHVLEKQLRNYIIERLTPTKTPVYGLSEPKVLDHRLDALNLAIVAFQLEFSDLHAQHVCTETASVADPRTTRHIDGSNKTQDERYSKPEERRMESAEMTWVEKQLFANRVKSDLSHIPSNRPGWSEDKENERRAEWLQRRRSRGNVERNRPNRSNI